MQTYKHIPNHDESLLHTLRAIKHRAFTINCIGHLDVAAELGYVKGMHVGLKLRHDQMIEYFSATYDGRSAMYFVLRGVKFVWADQTERSKKNE